MGRHKSRKRERDLDRCADHRGNDDGTRHANVQLFWQYIVVGIIVILAVLIDQARDIIVGRIETG